MSRHLDQTLNDVARVRRILPASTVAQALAVLEVRQTPRQRMSAVAKRVGLSRAALTACVDRLEAAGIVQRIPVETDRRAYELDLTPKGRKLVDRELMSA